MAEELDAEFAFHLDERTAQLVALGVPATEARAQARREFGDAAGARAYCLDEDLAAGRATRRRHWLADAAFDMRHALRQLRRQPAFTAAAALTLALGIGATAAIFAMVDHLVLRPLPYPDAGRLVAVLQTDRGVADPSPQISYGDFHDLRAATEALDGMAVYLVSGLTVTSGGPAVRAVGRIVSDDYFRLLGARAILGRTFVPDDIGDEGARVAVLAHAFWRSRYAGDSGIVGRTMTIDGTPVPIVGVLGPEFTLARPSEPTEVYLPLDPAGRVGNRGFYGYYAIARRAPGTSLPALHAALAVLGRRLEADNPTSNAGRSFTAIPLREALLGDTRTTLWALFGAAGFVLLIATANLANLLLARHVLRAREFAVRAALGASAGRLARQLLLEVQVLTVFGAGGGLALAWLGVTLVRALGWPDAAASAGLAVDGRVAAFGLALAVAAGGVSAVAAARGSRVGRLAALRSGTRAGTGRAPARVRRLLVATETALAFVLLVGAGLMLTTLAAALRTDPGFDSRNLVTVRVAPPNTRFTSIESAAAYFDRLADDLRAIPGVLAVTMTSQVPLSGNRSGSGFVRDDRPLPPGRTPPLVNYQVVSPGFFAVMGIPLVAGREFTASDLGRQPHRVVITDEIARTLYPGEDPVGKRVHLGANSEEDAHEIIGVAKAVRHFGLADAPLTGVYDLYGQHGGRSMAMLIRTGLPVGSLLPTVREHLARFDPEAPLYAVSTLDDLARATVAGRRTVLILLGVFSGLALVLAVVGIYGVVAQTVRAQLREYGIRMALGAEPRRVRAGVLGGGVAMAAAGVAAGILAGALLTRALSGLLYGVAPLDPVTFSAVGAVLLVAAGLAAAGPARRAGRVDVAGILRDE